MNIPLLLKLLILILVLVRPLNALTLQPILEFDWIGLILTAAALLLMDYVLSYGLTYDWLTSNKIIAAILASCLALTLLLSHALIIHEPVLQLQLLSMSNVRAGVIMMFLFGLFYAFSNILDNILGIVLKVIRWRSPG